MVYERFMIIRGFSNTNMLIVPLKILHPRVMHHGRFVWIRGISFEKLGNGNCKREFGQGKRRNSINIYSLVAG